jgi:hypothetical protein
MYLKELLPQTETETTMKVKMFVRHSLEDVESRVNEWMEQNNVRISHVAQSQCEKQGKFVFVLSVFYETAGS